MSAYPPILDEVLTTQEAAAIYHVGTSTIRMALRAGRLAGRQVRIGKYPTWLIARADAERLWKDHRPKETPPA